MTKTILRIDSSARTQGSTSRALADYKISLHEDADVITRDVNSLPHIDETWVGATFTPDEARSEAQVHSLELSDAILAEVNAADHIVISAPLYNFTIPSSLKAWFDHIARAGVSFKYTETGPVGLLKNTPVTVIIASGGVTLGSPADFASDYIRMVFGFVGITDVTIIGAQASTIEGAKAQISERAL